ncbi:MAG: hypothetical protein CSA20_06155 [Deltaproteobacteria bacterium]|nr:MAG: hypothetical protein CSA20_06155 [Deltaproteobacteria bacterium]
MIIEKLPSHNKSEYVYDQIVKAIRSGQYKVGDRLPPELELAEMAGVSRTSVREALSALRLVGAIETKKGNGTFIKTCEFGFSAQKTRFDSNLNTFEILEARNVVEPAVAKLALEVLDDKGLEKIKAAFLEMELTVRRRAFRRYHEANKNFHSAIADATRNRSLIEYVHSLQVVFIDSEFGAKLRRRYLMEEDYVRQSVEVHREICKAFITGDGKSLVRAWKRHKESLESQLLGK